MELRLKQQRGNNLKWHWKENLQLFTSNEKAFQFNFKDQTFVIKPWQVNELPIGFGVKKGSTEVVIFIGNNITKTTMSPNRIRQWIFENCHGLNTK